MSYILISQNTDLCVSEGESQPILDWYRFAHARRVNAF